MPAQLWLGHTQGAMAGHTYTGNLRQPQTWLGHMAQHTYRGICASPTLGNFALAQLWLGHTHGAMAGHIHTGNFALAQTLARTHTWGTVRCWESRTTWRRRGRGRAGSWEESETGHKRRPAGRADRLSGTQNHLPAPCLLRPAH